jgi:hypothetical protein
LILLLGAETVVGVQNVDTIDSQRVLILILVSTMTVATSTSGSAK